MSSVVNAFYSRLQEESFLAALRERIGTERIDLDKHPELQAKMEQYKQFCERQRKRQLKRAEKIKKRDKKDKKRKKEKKEKRKRKANRAKKKRERKQELSSSSSASETDHQSDSDDDKKRKRKRQRSEEASAKHKRKRSTTPEEERKKKHDNRKRERSPRENDKCDDEHDRLAKIEREMMEMELRKAALAALMEALKKEKKLSQRGDASPMSADKQQKSSSDPFNRAESQTTTHLNEPNRTTDSTENLERELRLRALLMKAKCDQERTPQNEYKRK